MGFSILSYDFYFTIHFNFNSIQIKPSSLVNCSKNSTQISNDNVTANKFHMVHYIERKTFKSCNKERIKLKLISKYLLLIFSSSRCRFNPRTNLRSNDGIDLVENHFSFIGKVNTFRATLQYKTTKHRVNDVVDCCVFKLYEPC